MKQIRFGLIGGGLMGREFASAAARWLHLDADLEVQPVLTGLADIDEGARTWFTRNVPALTFATDDYRRLLARDDIDAIYCAVPHDLHEQVYIDVIESGRHLLGEKPFGIDARANRAIIEAASKRPDLVVRCSSEFPYFPGAIAVHDAVRSGRIGEVIEARASFAHSSDLDRSKPINWKRVAATNGEYGVMGDLGFHVLHLPLRLGWRPRRLWSVLSDIVTERPTLSGASQRCDTWDNAIVLAQTEQGFPLLLETKRIAPGEMNTFSLEVYGDRGGVRWSSKHTKSLWTLEYQQGSPQSWACTDLGSQSVYRTLTGPIFEFGFSDAVLQMWAAFCDEIGKAGHPGEVPFACGSLEETRLHHNVLTAALDAARCGHVSEVLDDATS